MIVDLWKHFSSETVINSSCRLKTKTLDGQTSIPASSSSWLEMVEKISELNQPSSFMMFVQICHQNLLNWKNNPGIFHSESQPLSLLPFVSSDKVNKNKIKVFTGRVNIKFTSSKALAQLNEYGVFHISSLLLCCASQFCEENTSKPHQIMKAE